MLNLRKLVLTLALLAGMGAGAVAAAGEAVIEQGETGIVVGATIFDYSNNFMSYVRSGIERNAAGRVKLLMVDSRGNQTVQNEVIDTLITKGAKVLAVNLVDPQSAGVIIEKAKAFDLPVVFFNKNPSQKDLDSYNKCWYVGVDAANQGKLQGDMVVEQWKRDPSKFDRNKDGILQYVLIQGEPGHSDTPLRTNAFEGVVAASGIKTEQLAKQPANWNTTRAKELMETWIGRFGNKIELVVSNNDAMAIGAAEALRANGMISKEIFTPVVGINALPEVAALIKDDVMFASILTDPTAQGKAVVELCINAGKGRFDNITYGTKWVLLPDKSVRIPDVIVTKANVDVAIQAYKK